MGFLLTAALRPLQTLTQTLRRDFCVGTRSLIRMHSIPKPREIERWNEKRVQFGTYDNIGILGRFMEHPRVLISGARWVRGWRGNELERSLRKKRMVGDRMFLNDFHSLNKRIRFLYKRFNRYGKHR
uniref:Large ribosomal subunit protein mL51 n=1 Tax=Callorhinchus milii TaxID=7868 RepID=V9LHF5_CALMI